jgi:hypothetical protein
LHHVSTQHLEHLIVNPPSSLYLYQYTSNTMLLLVPRRTHLLTLFLVLVLNLLEESACWTTHQQSLPTNRRVIKMDTEGPIFPFTKPIPSLFWKQPSQQQKVPVAYHDMPWRSSLATEADCVYMPFWEWQLDYFQTHLSNFQIHPLANTTWEYICNAEKQTRMVTLVASSDEYRQIRMTYLDAGEKTQIFTSVCYPRGNLPILGIDLLQFGKQGVAICDFQPIHAT